VSILEVLQHFHAHFLGVTHGILILVVVFITIRHVGVFVLRISVRSILLCNLLS
jgi:hypothetical protein